MFSLFRKKPLKGYVLAPKRLVEQRLPVRFLYREAPDNPQDTGWRVFAGDESEEYINVPDNIAIYDVQTILSISPDIGPLLPTPAGHAFERPDPKGPFVEIPFDFGGEDE